MVVEWDVVRNGGLFQPVVIINGEIIRFTSVLTYALARRLAKETAHLVRNGLLKAV